VGMSGQEALQVLLLAGKVEQPVEAVVNR
jgi:hypothetical protein